jgi:Tfp pilus assembly protein PilN
MKAVNLIPAEHREGAAVGIGRSEGAAYAFMGLLAGLALLALLYGMAKHQVDSRGSQAATLAAQAQAAQGEATELVPYTTFAAMREQRQQDVSTLVASRFDWAHAFHELGRVIPPNVSIASLSGTIAAAATSAAAAAVAAPAASTPVAQAAPVASSTPPGAVPTFALTGCAVNQKDVALFLVRLRLMDGVSLVTLQSSTATRASGESSTGGGACGAGAPTFSLVVAFDPLPSTAAETASETSKTKTVANTATPATTSTPTTTPGSSLR